MNVSTPGEGRCSSSAATYYEFDPPRVMRVDCSQFAACRWHGKRLVSKLGPQAEPCPRCGNTVVA